MSGEQNLAHRSESDVDSQYQISVTSTRVGEHQLRHFPFPVMRGQSDVSQFVAGKWICEICEILSSAWNPLLTVLPWLTKSPFDVELVQQPLPCGLVTAAGVSTSPGDGMLTAFFLSYPHLRASNDRAG